MEKIKEKINTRNLILATIGSGVALIILAAISLSDGSAEVFLFTLLALIVFVISIGVLVANEFSSIAAEKGYVNKKYFWFTFLIPVVGMLMVIALPDRRNSMTHANNESFELNELPEL